LRCRRPSRRWWLWLTLASGLAIGAFALQSVPAEAASSSPPTVFAGLSSQQFPSFFEISNNGRMLKLGAIVLGMTCTMLTGTWRVEQTYISSTGQTDQCDSGPVRFTDTD
jgi:H+/Cl- antiporter ClcA